MHGASAKRGFFAKMVVDTGVGKPFLGPGRRKLIWIIGGCPGVWWVSPESPAFRYLFPKSAKKSQVYTRDSKENTTVLTGRFFAKNCPFCVRAY